MMEIANFIDIVFMGVMGFVLGYVLNMKGNK